MNFRFFFSFYGFRRNSDENKIKNFFLIIFDKVGLIL